MAAAAPTASGRFSEATTIESEEMKVIAAAAGSIVCDRRPTESTSVFKPET